MTCRPPSGVPKKCCTENACISGTPGAHRPPGSETPPAACRVAGDQPPPLGCCYWYGHHTIQGSRVLSCISCSHIIIRLCSACSHGRGRPRLSAASLHHVVLLSRQRGPGVSCALHRSQRPMDHQRGGLFCLNPPRAESDGCGAGCLHCRASAPDSSEARLLQILDQDHTLGSAIPLQRSSRQH